MKIINKKKFNVRTLKGIFSIILEEWENERGYTVRVPKFPEIVTEGDSIKEAKKMAKEAIELCIECMENEHHTYTKSKRLTAVAS